MRHTLLPPSTAVSYSPSAYNLRRNRKVGATLHLPSLLHLFLFLLLCSLLCRIPQARAADILDFNDDNGLPSCAHGCTDLYSAQYECQDQSDHEAMIKCFCESGFTHRKDREWDCGTACTRPEDKGRLKGWVNGVCRSVEMASSTRTIKESATPSPTEEVDKEKDQPKAKESWWTKNWPYFLIAFLLSAIAVLLLAFSFPIRRSAQGYFVRRRVRKSGLPDIAYNHWTAPEPSSVGSAGAPFLTVAGAGPAGRWGMLGGRAISGETTQTARSGQTASTNLTSNTGASSWFEGEWLGSPRPDGWPSFAYEGAAGVAGGTPVVTSPRVLSPGLPAPVTQAGMGNLATTTNTGGPVATGGFRGSGYIAAEDESADLGTCTTNRSSSFARSRSRTWREVDDPNSNNYTYNYIGPPHNGRHWDEEEWTPKPIASSVRQESWERRLRAKFERSRSSGDERSILGKLAFWRKNGSGDSGGGYGKIGESNPRPRGSVGGGNGIWGIGPGLMKSPEEEGTLGF